MIIWKVANTEIVDSSFSMCLYYYIFNGKRSTQSGGYLLVDEIENHFNKEIVTTLVRFFMDSRFNKNGGTLIFTTHYPELLDEYDRNDGIYIVRNRNGITVENLSYILIRNDIKRSDAYQSGFLEGTTPTYEAYIRLKKSLANCKIYFE